MSALTLLVSSSTRLVLPLFLGVLLTISPLAAERIDGSVEIDGETRGYSFFVPDTYSSDRAWPLMLAMHPLNPSRWNARSWCDTLVDFAEENGLLLICPDGGPGGNLTDEAIDTALASRLMDSMSAWYSIDSKRIYIGGFSIGGAATYSYGLAESTRFGGLMPIGAAVSGTNGFEHLLSRARDMPVAVIHGSLDAPATRFTPVVSALEDAGAILRTELLPGVGHTIDFPNRNQILTDAFRWLDSVNLSGSINSVREEKPTVEQATISPNPVNPGRELVMGVRGQSRIKSIALLDAIGKEVSSGLDALLVSREEGSVIVSIPESVADGLYLIHITTEAGQRYTGSVIVR